MKPKLADFSIIDQHVQKAKTDYALADDPAAFYYIFLRSVFGLEATDIEDAITDDHFWIQRGRTKGKDRGVDAGWWKLYPKAEKVIAKARKAAKAKGGEKYEDVLYFKNSAAKTAIAALV
jgi:hypothetical protein